MVTYEPEMYFNDKTFMIEEKKLYTEPEYEYGELLLYIQERLLALESMERTDNPSFHMLNCDTDLQGLV